jgi:hypothetical protein
MGDLAKHFDVLIKKHYYIHERYGVDVTFALLYHAEPLAIDVIGGLLRLSDHLHQVDENHYFIVFDFTNQANAHKACQNLLCRLDDHFRDTESCIALDAFDTTKSTPIVLRRLQQILSEVRKRPRVRIDNETILDGRM